MIQGNIEGIREFTLSVLNTLYEIKLEKEEFITPELLIPIAEISAKINREISISIDRKGNVLAISIGDNKTASVPLIIQEGSKLCGIRIFHTHPNGNSHLSDVDLSALMKLRLDAMTAIGITLEGKINDISVGFCQLSAEDASVQVTSSISLEQAVRIDYLQIVKEIESATEKNGIHTEINVNFAVLVGIEHDRALNELKELAEACEIETVGKFLQKRSRADKTTFIGSGKVQELNLYKQIKKANLVIFDDELSGIQVKNLEEILACKVIDRTILILEIFARRAVTREGKIQVELAQLKYRSTKLIGYGISMSRAGFGIRGGSGETKLEMDRRRIRDNIDALKKELDEIKRTRATQREKREQSGILQVALVGYTNAGKSTLRNVLTQQYPVPGVPKSTEVFTKNMLFATLDVTTRAIQLPSKQIISMTDTVGFIRKLPHDLVEAFKSTLDEVSYADVIVHVVDGESEEIVEEIRAVEAVLLELNASEKPTILAINKIDCMESEILQTLRETLSGYIIVEISAKHHTNIDILLQKIEKVLPQKTERKVYLIPYQETALVAYLHRIAVVEQETYVDAGILIHCLINQKNSDKMERYQVFSEKEEFLLDENAKV